MTRSERSNIAPNRIREVRTQQELTLEQLAEKIGITFSSLAKLERSQRTLSVDVLAKIARALEVSPAELLGKASSQRFRAVPMVSSVGKGDWEAAIIEASGEIYVPEAGANCFALVPVAGSMGNLAPENAAIVIDTDDFDLREGRIYAVLDPNKETIFKRYRTEPARYEAVSIGSSEQDIPLGRSDYRVIGRVIWQAGPI